MPENRSHIDDELTLSLLDPDRDDEMASSAVDFIDPSPSDS